MGFDINEHINTLNEEQRNRLQHVRDEQEALGMQYRNDSLLSFNYAIENVPDFMNDAKTVAKELFIVDFIFKNTNYADIIEDVMREVASHVKFKYRVSWNTAWDITRFYVPDMLKMYCLRKSNLELPI